MDIHPAAVVSGDARIGTGVRIGPFAVVEDGVEIGGDCEIRAHATIRRYTTLGPGNVVFEGAVIGGEPQDVSFTPCESYLRIGSGNQIREGVTIHRGTQPGSTTIVGSGCFLMANSHIAHNCHIEDGVILANNVALAGYVMVGKKAFISGGVVIHQFCRVGRIAMIGGNSKIVQDCLPFVITDGMPGRASGLNIVGLRRAGFTSKETGELKAAYRILLRSGLRLEEAVQQIEAMTSPAAGELARFAVESKRGFCHADRNS